MTNANPSMHADLAYLRSLAEAGREGPLTSGPWLLAAGLWYGAASFVHWLIATGTLAVGPTGYLYLWVGASLGYPAIAIVIGRKARRIETTSNRIINAAWLAVAIGILSFWVAVALISLRSDSPFVWVTMPLITLAVYGMAWWIASAITHKSWMRTTAVASFACVPLAAWFYDSTTLFLVYSVCLVLTAGAPGYLMIRENRSIAG